MQDPAPAPPAHAAPWGAYAPAWRRGAWAALAAAAVLAGLRIAFSAYDHDELQHLHIAWLTAGGQVPYRDFWDNHGPLFTLLNAAGLRLAWPPAGLDYLVGCRLLAAACTAGIVALTGALARTLGLGRTGALVAAALLGLLYWVQDKGAECRPDPLQNLLWLAGLLLVARHLLRRSPAALALAGALFGLAVLTNAKAGIGPAAVGAYLLLGHRLHGLGARKVAGDLATLAGGAALAALPVAAGFAAKGALGALVYGSVGWNLAAVALAPGADGGDLFASFLARQWPFALAAVAGWAALAAHCARAAPGAGRAVAGLLLVVAAGTTAGWALNLYPQFFLVFLPLLAVVAAFGLQRAVALAGDRRARQAGLAAVAGAAALFLVAASAGQVTWRPDARRDFQEAFTRRIMAAVPRDAPVGVLWNNCGGYVFNPGLQYYWGAEAAIGWIVENETGTNPFGAPLVAALEGRRPRHVVGEDIVLANLPPDTGRYLREHYDYAACLWTRRDP